jgi:hypothetical protein
MGDKNTIKEMKCLKVVVNSRNGQIQKVADKIGEMS